MKELQLIFKTREGVSLFFDGAAFHTENIEAIKKALNEDLNSKNFIDKNFAELILIAMFIHPIIERY